MDSYLAPLVAAVLMILIENQGMKVAKHIKRFQKRIIRIGEGLVLGTFFIEILPQLSVAEVYLGHFIYHSVYLVFLVGFILIYTIETLYHRRFENENNSGNEKKKFETFGMAIYGFLLGFVIVLFFSKYSNLAFILLIPFYVNGFTISLTLRPPTSDLEKHLHNFSHYIVPLLGTIIALILIGNRINMFYAIFSFSMGIFLYILVRDITPFAKEARIYYFIAGAVIAFLISLIFATGLYITIMRSMVS